jgi:hypothetical protein
VGSSFPAAGIMGEHRPLAPSFMTSWEPSPMEMGSMMEAKTWLLAAAIRGWRSPPQVRFPPFRMCSVLEPGRTEWDGSIPRAWNGSDPVFGSEKFEEWDGSIFCSVESSEEWNQHRAARLQPASAPLACNQPPRRSPATSRRPARLQPAAAPLACDQPPPACNQAPPPAPASSHRTAPPRLLPPAALRA